MISPPPEPTPLTKFLDRRTGTNACEPSEPFLWLVSARHCDEGVIAYGSNYSPSRSPPKGEKPSVEQKSEPPTLDELVARAKAFEAARLESSLAKRPPLRRTQTPNSRSSSSSSGREQPHPAERPIPAFLADLREEVMWAFENPVTGWVSKLVHDCKMMSKKERREDLDRESFRLPKFLFCV